MKNSKSIVFKRQQAILKELREKREVDVDSLSKLLEVSPATVRRDLQMFEQQKLVTRFHGGARLLTQAFLQEDPSLAPVSQSDQAQKEVIAQYAANLVEDGDTIFLNSSTTTLLMLNYIKNKRVVVVTNNGNASLHPKDSRVELILTGGELYDRKRSMVGEFALSTLSKIIADKAFIGVGGISVAGGLTTSVLPETAVNSMMISRCKGPCYVLTANPKIGRQHNFLSAPIDQVDTLITGKGGDEAELKRLREFGIEVIELDAAVK